MSIGESVNGWVYWTWKVRQDDRIALLKLTKAIFQAENSDEWSYSKGIEGGWIPQNATNRMYPNICSD